MRRPGCNRIVVVVTGTLGIEPGEFHIVAQKVFRMFHDTGNFLYRLRNKMLAVFVKFKVADSKPSAAVN